MKYKIKNKINIINSNEIQLKKRIKNNFNSNTSSQAKSN